MYMEIQSSRIMCKKDYPFYIELPLILFRKSFRHTCVGPFLSTLQGPIGLCVHVHRYYTVFTAAVLCTVSLESGSVRPPGLHFQNSSGYLLALPFHTKF